jgi:endonuclease/exonuclease/phosphatase family metal-dependent hydrolase
VSGESGRLLVRTWNLFHGNTVPPGRRAYLREMIELATADRPSILCLQEVPVWALASLARWSGMTAFGAVAARPRLRSAELGRWLTELNHGLLRSAFTGQANAILVDRRAREERTVVVSSGGERRVCQTVRVDDLVVANLHVTPGTAAESQLERALEAVEDEECPVIVAGDANLRPGETEIYTRLLAEGFSEPLAGSIDQILVRGVPATAPAAWPQERRRIVGRLLSDHAPVELTVG